MEKTKDGIKKMLREQYEKCCNSYLSELLRMWDLAGGYGYWVGDDVGGVYDYGDGVLVITMENIIYCVENDVTEEQYQEWSDYCVDAIELGLGTPNLKSWMRGCPRTSKEFFNKIRQMRSDMDRAIEEEKSRMKGF